MRLLLQASQFIETIENKTHTMPCFQSFAKGTNPENMKKSRVVPMILADL
jgi:hypothetical protein